MRTTLTTPDRLFDRLWQPGHPFRPRCGRGRRWTMIVLLALLTTAITGYWWITDPVRVRDMAESYLSDLTGGRVTVGDASLSIFEGLKLSQVTVKVEESSAPDATLFVADAFDIQYDPASLFTGKLEATRIIATGPHVHLVEDIDGSRWNYQRLVHPSERPGSTRPGEETQSLPLPEIVLRNAKIEYSEIRDRKYASRGTMAIEGRLSPSVDGSHYSFEFQSRGAVEGVGPVVSGRVQLADGKVVAALTNFRFGRDIEAMLPSEVRDWWLAHQLEGALNIPDFRYTPAARGRRATFHLETQLDRVHLAVRPQELASDEVSQRLNRKHESVALMRRLGLDLVNGVTELETVSTPPTIAIEDVSGVFVFDDDGITFDKVSCSLDHNTLTMSGKIDGYTPDATVHVRLESPPGSAVRIPANLRYVASLPNDAREIYNLLNPHGVCTLWMEVDRKERGGRPEVSGELKVIDGEFSCRYFPYPIRAATGTLIFGREAGSGFERMEIQNVRGRGVAGGANENSFIAISGWVGPFDNTVGCNIRAEADSVNSEPALYDAFPQEVRDALKFLVGPAKASDPKAGAGSSANEEDATSTSAKSAMRAPLFPAGHDAYTSFPRFHGKFVCDVIMPIGPETKPIVNTDITFDDAGGKLAAFPYPLRHMTGTLKVRQGLVDVVNVQMRRGDALMTANGRVTWPSGEDADASIGITPELKITARDVPIDSDLLAALPADKQDWLGKAGLGGKLDVEGRILAARPKPPSPTALPGDRLAYDFNIRLHDGSALPLGKDFAVSDLTAQLQVTQDSLLVQSLRGRRGDSDLFADGSIDYSAEHPHVSLAGGATRLSLDDSLYKLLPQSARDIWDAINPHGLIDANFTYNGANLSALNTAIPGGASATTSASTVPSATALLSAPSTQPAADYSLTLRPRDLSVMPRAIPYRLDQCSGGVTVTPSGITLTDIAGRHGDATLSVSGTGSAGEQTNWDLKVLARNVPVDSELGQCLPPGVKQVMDSLHLSGALTLNLSRFQYRSAGPTDPTAAASAASPPVVLPASPPPTGASADIDLTGALSTDAAALDAGVPLDHVAGGMTFNAAIRAGQLSELHGDLAIASLNLAARPVRDLKAELAMDAGTDSIHIRQIQGSLAGGEFAGSVDLNFPDQHPANYLLDIVLKNADLRTVGGLGQDVHGQLSASLALEGEWTDLNSRRGRGDVLVAGKQMYQIPLLLGLFEVTNLSLPSASPFSEGTARYAVEGKRVTFDQIQMRSDSMVMNGDGWLDFGTKKVRLNFSTDNPNMPKLPFIHDLWQGAKQELFQIQVRGTVQEPRVSAASLHTFTTTVDEVFNGNGKEK